MNDNPQKENGYTPISNEIMDNLIKIRIKGEARQVLDFILRKTYGWNKKEDYISLSQFVRATNLKRPIVCRSLKYLLNLNLIIKNDNTIIKKDNEWMITYQFNKHYTTWKPLSKKIMHYQKCKLPSIKNDNQPLSKMIHTKDTLTKAIIQKKERRTPPECFSFIHSYKKLYDETYPNPYISQPKDFAIAKNIIKKMGGLEKSIELINKYFGIKDEWLRDTVLYGLGYLSANMSKILNHGEAKKDKTFMTAEEADKRRAEIDAQLQIVRERKKHESSQN